MRRILGTTGLVFVLSMMGCQAQECPKCEPASAETICGQAQACGDNNSDATVVAKGDKALVEAGGETIALPKRVALDVSLTKALEARKSVRAYEETMISIQDLSNLLWSANGINREDGKRTAPSARNLQSVSIYVAFEKGAYLYDFKAHQLTRVTEADVRTIKEAPLELIFTSNFEAKSDSAEDREFAQLIRGIDAGTASENAALYCATAGLGTVIRMYHQADPEKAAALKLTEKDHMLFHMAVGYGK